MTVTGPPWVWLVTIIAIVAVLILTVIASVEIAISRRLREIKALFRDALMHARSFDGAIEEIREERKRDRDTVLEVLHVQARQADEVERLKHWRDEMEGLAIIRAAKQGGHHTVE